ncbi:MAG: cobalt transporter CbiM [Syntrophobacteraceae bacterium]|nr:cobalt transporter CbiM [Syntrophobacteraceae bacterium]
MHIPDGYLSPSSCAALGAVMIPAWAVAVAKVRDRIKSRYVPLMAIGAAFSFTIMMYNVPIPGGTTAHAVGGGLLAVVLGPFAAMICITIALAIQALLFGDGGVWTFTANCFNMALVLPFVAYGAYRLIGGKSGLDSKRRWVGAAVGGYLGLCVAALCAGVELGLQPVLFHTAGGVPLYCPYSLKVSVPAMLLAHLVVAGPLEAVVTGLVVRYLQAYSTDLMRIGSLGAQSAPLSATLSYRKMWWALGAMVVLSPLGLLAGGTAWGEWQTEELQKLTGFIPAGLKRMAGTWSFAPFRDYTLPGIESFQASAVIYIFCALFGVGIICLFTYFFGRLQLSEKKKHN